MPQKAQVQVSSGEQEQAHVCLLSELIESLVERKQLTFAQGKFTLDPKADEITITIPDSGKGEFKGSHPWKNDESKDTKAVFIVSTIGSDRAGFPIPYRQSQGDVNGLPLSVKLSIIATVPNQAGKTIDEALNRKVELTAVPPQTETKTGTNN